MTSCLGVRGWRNNNNGSCASERGGWKTLCKTTFLRSANWIMCFPARRRQTRHAVDPSAKRSFFLLNSASDLCSSPRGSFCFISFSFRRMKVRVKKTRADAKFHFVQAAKSDTKSRYKWNAMVWWWSPCLALCAPFEIAHKDIDGAMRGSRFSLVAFWHREDC